jgi:RNA polymerase sigma-70 factor (ECF subfamily)
MDRFRSGAALGPGNGDDQATSTGVSPDGARVIVTGYSNGVHELLRVSTTTPRWPTPSRDGTGVSRTGHLSLSEMVQPGIHQLTAHAATSRTLGARRAQAEVSTSFESFYEAESRPLYRRLCLITRNRHDAEEIMQDAFLRLWERWDRVGGLENPVGYLYRTAFNLSTKRRRRALLAIRRTLSLSEAGDEAGQTEDRLTVASALAGLTPRQRAAVVLTDLLGYSSEEASDVLGVRASTVRALATQGRAVLKKSLGGE